MIDSPEMFERYLPHAMALRVEKKWARAFHVQGAPRLVLRPGRASAHSPEMFERYLPHAMALRVEKKWARAFEDMYREPPDWYSGPAGHHFRPTIFVSDLGSMTGDCILDTGAPPH